MATPTNTLPKPQFRGELLQKIYRVWLLRRLLPVLALEIAVLSLLLWKLGKMIFLERVVQNATNVLFLNPSGIFSFGIEAFSNAFWTTKIAGILVVIGTALLIRHITQGILRFILVRENYFGKVQK